MSDINEQIQTLKKENDELKRRIKFLTYFEVSDDARSSLQKLYLEKIKEYADHPLANILDDALMDLWQLETELSRQRIYIKKLEKVVEAARKEQCRFCAAGNSTTDIHNGRPAEYHGYEYNRCETPLLRESLFDLDK